MNSLVEAIILLVCFTAVLGLMSQCVQIVYPVDNINVQETKDNCQ